MESKIAKSHILIIIIFMLLSLTICIQYGYSDVGAVQVIAEHRGKLMPEAKVTIFKGNEVIVQRKTDRCGTILFPLEEGEYNVLLIASKERTLKKTVTVVPGELISLTGDLTSNLFTSNELPLPRYRMLSDAHVVKGYSISQADLGGLLSFQITTPFGIIYLSLPYIAVPGEIVSWSAILLPFGNTTKQRMKNHRLISAYKVLISNGEQMKHESLNEKVTFIAKIIEKGTLILSNGKKGKKVVRAPINLYTEGAKIREVNESFVKEIDSLIQMQNNLNRKAIENFKIEYNSFLKRVEDFFNEKDELYTQTDENFKKYVDSSKKAVTSIYNEKDDLFTQTDENFKKYVDSYKKAITSIFKEKDDLYQRADESFHKYLESHKKAITSIFKEKDDLYQRADENFQTALNSFKNDLRRIKKTNDKSVDNNILATAGWPVCIRGKFDGVAENTQVKFAGSPLKVQAETLYTVIFNPPKRPVGLQIVEIVEGGVTRLITVRNVLLQLAADKLELTKGEITQLHLSIAGLADLKHPIFVSLINHSSNVVTMSGGNSQFISITAKDINTTGEALYNKNLTGINRGDFSISARLWTW